ncbi:MAG: Rossmann-like and DUF2520 domain-containing protein [Eubacteriales bacterium]
MFRVGVIGTGVVGSAVALLLRQKGYDFTGVCSKSGVSAARLAASLGCKFYSDPADVLVDARIVFLTVPDREIDQLARRLADSEYVNNEHVFFHMSGALPAEVLHPLQEKGSAIGSLHPLQSFASIEKAVENLPNSFFAVQGDAAAAEIAFALAETLSGKPFMLKSEDKALYHLGACIASNYLVALIHFAVGIYRQIGLTDMQATEALMPLIRGTLANIELLGPAKALTGPVARGDINTIEKHLGAIGNLAPGQADLYKYLGSYTTQVAVEKGSIDNTNAEKLLCIFRGEVNQDVRQ